MARLARLVVPGMPHHITQRGNRRQQTFFNDGDYAAYLELMAERCCQRGVEICSYCLMPNHVHLIAAPRRRTACGGQSVGPMNATRGGSTSGKNGGAISGKGVLLRS